MSKAIEEYREDCFMEWLDEVNGELYEMEEGCLQDNYLFCCDDGWGIAFELPLNEWSSTHKVCMYPSQIEADEAWEKFTAWARGE